MRRDLSILTAIVAVAFAVRVYPAWDAVFGGGRVNFLETDAWYHVRLVENQVRNFPWRITLDPYAAPGGQFVAIAPLFDTITATTVVVLYGRNADTASVEHVAAVIPPVLGVLTVIVIWGIGRLLFDRRAGLVAAALLAVLPGHFMDRTMLGFVDHHALEALLAMTTVLAIAHALRTAPPSPCGTSVPQPRTRPPSFPPGQTGRSSGRRTEVVTGSVARVVGVSTVGLSLGLYLLAWSSGAFLIAILGMWLLLLIPLARDHAVLASVAHLMAGASLVGLLLVLALQDPQMHRYGSQIVGLLSLAALALATVPLAGGDNTRKPIILTGFIVVAVVAGVTVRVLTPALFQQLLIDIGRLRPDPTRMGVLEARPLFLYPGEWNWLQPWQFFRSGFYVGLVALVLFSARVWRRRDAADLIVWVYGLATFVATIGQNRFGYYLVTACALLGGWLATRILDWGNVARIPLSREVALGLVASAMFAPNLAPSALLMPRTASLAGCWQDAMTWLGRETPPPFLHSVGTGDDFYYERYPRDLVPAPDYSIMNWWDQGYWIVQRARRVAVSNPTQARALNAARFYVETDEQRAVEIARDERARFVLTDWEMPFRLTPERTMMGRFQSVLDWAGVTHSHYYEVYYRRQDDEWTPIWVFHAPYYQSMAYRLMVLGGATGTPVNATSVITIADRDDGRDRKFREVLTVNTYPSYEAALQAAVIGQAAAQTMIVGLDPWQPAVPVPPVPQFVERHAVRTPEQKSSEAPWVRVFEVMQASPPRPAAR